MKRTWRIMKVIVMAFSVLALTMPTRIVTADDSVAQTITTPVIVAPSTDPLIATAPDIIMTAFSAGDRLDAVELYNQSSNAVWLGDVSILTLDGLGNVQTIPLQQGFLLSKHYITFADNTQLFLGALPFGTQQHATADNIVKISIIRNNSVTQSVNVPPSTGNISTKDNYLWAQHKQRGNASLKQTGDFATDFTKKSTALTVEGTELYAPASSAKGLRITEIHASPLDCAPVAESVLNLACSDYVKLVNSSDEPINLTQYRLRVGAYGDSSTISNTFNWHESTMSPEDEYMLNPHESFVVHLRDDLKPIGLTATGKYAWVEDYFGTTTYDSVQYPDMTLAKYSGFSWAYDSMDATWKAGIPSPQTVENAFPPAPTDAPAVSNSNDSTLVACGVNQYRSPETNRCRALVSTILTPCRDGQYRSEDTGRCRSIVQTVAASLKPCGDDQFRKPDTGRCKKIASTEDVIQPCDAGWERNPETNRCRKVKATSMPLAAFPVESIGSSASRNATALGVGGVMLGAFGYAAWEWRREVGAGVRGLLRKLTFRR